MIVLLLKHWSAHKFLPLVFFMFMQPDLPVPSAEPPVPDVLEEAEEPQEVKLDLKSPQVIFDVLVQAYPDKIHSPAVRQGDWSLIVSDQVFYWAEGRMLPEEERESADLYTSYGFYPNPVDMPPLRQLSEEQVQQLKHRVDQQEQRQRFRHFGFMDALWGMENQQIAADTIIQTEFLGQFLIIHPGIREALEKAEAEVLQLTDPESKTWLAELGGAGGYVWREIAGSANRSLHSYGIAVDLTPKDYRDKQAYWRWARVLIDEWWAVPYEQRYTIPDPVVKIFEKHGFIWGGKWFMYDQIHFEYRPELVILGQIADEQKRSD